ncbi:hypothetical protein RBB50_005888 [Rhinocladiella similis]
MATKPPSSSRLLTPVHFFSHGTPSLLGEESESADYWKKCGDLALRHGVKHIVIMGAHWAALNDEIQVSMNPNPSKDPIGGVHPRKYYDYKLIPDLPMGETVIQILRDAGFNCNPSKSCLWIHDIYTLIIRMFPDGNMPPTTIISTNARYDPHFHMRVGMALRPLRSRPDVLLMGTGGAVHNLYRNIWGPIVKYNDNFAQEVPPANWALNFRQEFEDAVMKNSGPALRRAVVSLMKLPDFRDAHGTDDHFVAACFCAGLVGHEEDVGAPVEFGAETWELGNMCNDQYTFGSWKGFPVVC